MTHDLLEEIELDESQRVSVTFNVADLEHLGFLMQLSPEVAIVTLLRRTIAATLAATLAPHAANGHGGVTLVCANCGREFTANRRSAAGRRAWCERPECKRAAANQRARDHRERKAKEVS